MTIVPRQMLVASKKYGLKCPYTMSPEYITVHNTANKASAHNEIQYMINNNNQVSFHFAIDDKEVVQGLPLNRNGWHAGDGSRGDGNRKSIAIEICYSLNGGEQYRRAEQLAVKFIAQLLYERNWNINKVKKHQDWSGKLCPHRILNENRWDQFLTQIGNELYNLKQPKQPIEKTDTLYRVVAGSFKERENAEAQVKYLKSKGIDSFILISK